MTEERFAELIAENAELRKRIVEVENQLIDADFAAGMEKAGVEYIRRDERRKVLQEELESSQEALDSWRYDTDERARAFCELLTNQINGVQNQLAALETVPGDTCEAQMRAPLEAQRWPERQSDGTWDFGHLGEVKRSLQTDDCDVSLYALEVAEDLWVWGWSFYEDVSVVFSSLGAYVARIPLKGLRYSFEVYDDAPQAIRRAAHCLMREQELPDHVTGWLKAVAATPEYVADAIVGDKKEEQ